MNSFKQTKKLYVNSIYCRCYTEHTKPKFVDFVKDCQLLVINTYSLPSLYSVELAGLELVEPLMFSVVSVYTIVLDSPEFLNYFVFIFFFRSRCDKLSYQKDYSSDDAVAAFCRHSIYVSGPGY